MFTQENALTVTDINNYIKALFENDMFLTDVWVRGEISNFKNHSSGHLYMSLKDENSVLRAVMFRFSASSLRFNPENGMKVLAHGKISSFPRDGQYQLYIDAMEPDGMGALYVAYEQLKRKLEANGLFSSDRKKPIPKIPSRVGIVTSPTGAAVRDMINVTGRRFPYAEIILYPTLVQGPDAPADLIRGVKYFNEKRPVDVLIIGRGGGSIEDLWAFNNEELAYAVAQSKIPIISAVGHETDFTICDFVADLRAPTPSAAAELAVPDTGELKIKLYNVVKREGALVEKSLERYRERLTMISRSRYLRDAGSFVNDKRMLLDIYCERLYGSENQKVLKDRNKLAALGAKLDALSPLSVLSRGYGAVTDGDGRIIDSVKKVNCGDDFTVKMKDGEISATVKGTTPKNQDVGGTNG